MKRFFAFVLAALMLLMFVSCASNDDTQTDTTAADTTDAPQTTEAEKIIPETLKLDGADISEYKIVYSKNIMNYVYSRYKDLVTQDTEYDEQTAKHLSQLIKEHFGAELQTTRETSDKKVIEIVTNKNLATPDADKFAGDKSYSIEMKDGRLTIYGSSYGATYHAAEALIEHILGLNVKDAELASDFKLEGEADMLVIACIGDSLTNGSKPSNYTTSGVDDNDRRDIVSYPAVMQRMMWKDAVVYNYGQGGRTMIEDFNWEGSGNHAYNASTQYPLLMENAANVDLALIMLGTNDANQNRLTEAGKAIGTARYDKEYMDSCENILNALKEKNADMKVLLLNAPVAYNSTFVDNLEYVRELQARTAEEFGLTLIDVYKYTNENMTVEDFPDQLHPDDEGYTTFAVGIHSLIEPTVNELLGKATE